MLRLDSVQVFVHYWWPKKDLRLGRGTCKCPCSLTALKAHVREKETLTERQMFYSRSLMILIKQISYLILLIAQSSQDSYWHHGSSYYVC